MAKGAFLYRNLAAGLPPTADSSAPVSGLEWSNLGDPQPRRRTRVDNASVILIFDLATPQSVDGAALISTSLNATATTRLRASTADPLVTSSLLHDSGVQAGVTDSKWNGNIIQAIPSPVIARYWRWDVTGSAPIDIGLAPIGLLFRPGRNFSFGIQEGRIDLSTRDTNPDTGAAFGVAGPVLRCRLLNFGGLSKSEARAQVEEMDRIVGASADVLFIEDTADSWIGRAQNSIWGSYRSTGQAELATRNAFNVFSRPYRIVERL
jgi:hypothetical protein